MKKQIRRIWGIWLLISLTVSLTGCQKKEVPPDSAYKIYYVNQEETGLLEEAYKKEIKDTKQTVAEMLKSLQKSGNDINVQPAIPREVTLRSYQLNKERLSLYFDKAYGEMDVVREVLCRAALVRTLTQIRGVTLVAFYVDGEPLVNKAGEAYGYFQADDFVQNTGSTINSYQETNLLLYFANEAGDRLIEETVEVRYNSNFPKEKVVLERLMKGPEGQEKGKATISKGTKLLGVSMKDGVCYLNFDEGILNIVPGVNPKVIIYSIVNSVAENSSVHRVQILVNGKRDMVFQESVRLEEPLRTNLDIVEEN